MKILVFIGISLLFINTSADNFTIRPVHLRDDTVDIDRWLELGQKMHVFQDEGVGVYWSSGIPK